MNNITCQSCFAVIEANKKDARQVGWWVKGQGIIKALCQKCSQEIGQRIRECRGDKSLRAFGALLGVSDVAAMRWERGHLPNEVMLRQIARVSKRKYEWLLCGRVDDHRPALTASLKKGEEIEMEKQIAQAHEDVCECPTEHGHFTGCFHSPEKEEPGILCDRCLEQKPILFRVYSDIINLYVCVRCALDALEIPPGGEGDLTVESLFPPVSRRVRVDALAECALS